VLHGTPFTSFPGCEISPAFSPDGTRVVFAWEGGGEEGGESGYDLYVKQRNTEQPLRLTSRAGDEYYPTWSPDGATIAFVGHDATGHGIFTIAAIGGPPRCRLALDRSILGLDWAADGDHLIYAAQDEPRSPRRLFELTLATGAVRAITSPPAGYHGDFLPVCSPDGHSIAFARGDRTDLQDVYVVDVDGGEPRRITFAQQQVRGLDWTPDGRHLVFTSGADLAGEFSMWRVAVADGEITRLAAPAKRLIRPAVAPAGGSLVYEEQTLRTNVVQYAITAAADTFATPTSFPSSTRSEYTPRYSPSGRQIAFISTRSGHPEIWVCDRDGGGLRQLTRLGGAFVESPRWSHDERRIAFDASPAGVTKVFVADLVSGTSREIGDADRHERVLSWSRDDRWLYLLAESEEGWQVWRRRLSDGTAEQVLAHGTLRLVESEDGERLLYSRVDAAGVWSLPLTGERREPQCLLDAASGAYCCHWRSTADGIYFFRLFEHEVTLAFHAFASGQVTTLTRIPRPNGFSFDVAPDGRSLLCDRLDPIESDLVLVDGFR
jgi:Tol biopolymer transport system component